MPKSKMQAEFVKATKVDPDDFEDRQDFLKAVVEKVNTFKDPQWDKLSEAAQDWINGAVKLVKAKKRCPEFPDVGSVPADDDKPAKKGKAKAEEADDEEDEEEDEKPAKKGKKAKAEAEDEQDDEEADDEEDEDSDDEEADEESDDDEDEDEEDEKPAKKKVAKKAAKPAKKGKAKAEADDEDEEDEKPKKKAKKAKAEADDEDEDEEDEKPKKKAKKAAKPDKTAAKPTGVKVAIKEAILANPDISVDDLVKKLGKGGADVSKVTVGNVRADFRHSLKVLKENGNLKGVEI